MYIDNCGYIIKQDFAYTNALSRLARPGYVYHYASFIFIWWRNRQSPAEILEHGTHRRYLWQTWSGRGGGQAISF